MAEEVIPEEPGLGGGGGVGLVLDHGEADHGHAVPVAPDLVMVSAGLIHQGGVQVLTAVPLQPVHHGRGQAGALVGAGILGAHQLDHGDPVGAGHRVEGGHILSHLLVHIPIAAGTDGHGGHHIGHLTGDHGAGVASVGMPGGIDPALVDGIALRHILDQLPPEGDVVRPGGVPAVVVDGPGHAVVLRIGV